MVIGEKIKRLRILNNLTQEELALRCDLTKGFISKLERDLTSPSIATLVDILEALGTDLKDFGQYILLVNFSQYVEMFAEKFKVEIKRKNEFAIERFYEKLIIFKLIFDFNKKN